MSKMDDRIDRNDNVSGMTGGFPTLASGLAKNWETIPIKKLWRFCVFDRIDR